MSNFWCEVNLKTIENNLNIIKDLVKDKKIIGVVKGDAYGLGITEISDFLKDKVDILAVGSLEEANKIDSKKEILILSPLCTLDDFNDERENLIFTLDNEAIIDNLSKDVNKKIHIYVDTGMNRMGIKLNRLDSVISKLREQYSNVEIQGIYTHLHNSKNVKYTLEQIGRFKNAVEKYKDEIPVIHCMASSGILNDELRKAADFTTAVRAGNILYGYIGFDKGIRKSYEYYAKLVNSCKVLKGKTVGYGCLYKAKKDMTIGVIECGNVHGLGITREIKNNLIYDIFRVAYRAFKERPIIFNKGIPVNILGKPNMNVTLIDMTNINIEDKLKIDISPIISESSIKKIYNYE